MSPYIKADQVISDMAMALCWITDLSDDRLIRRELTCAGFEPDVVDRYIERAVLYARFRRQMFGGPNQMTQPEMPDEDK